MKKYVYTMLRPIYDKEPLPLKDICKLMRIKKWEWGGTKEQFHKLAAMMNDARRIDFSDPRGTIIRFQQVHHITEEDFDFYVGAYGFSSSDLNDCEYSETSRDLLAGHWFEKQIRGEK